MTNSQLVKMEAISEIMLEILDAYKANIHYENDDNYVKNFFFLSIT